MEKRLNFVFLASLSFVFSTVAQAPEIKVEGNLGTYPEIVSGDTNPQGTDNTLFASQLIGSSQSKSYRIRNLGTLNLSITSVKILGANPDDFSITVTPTSVIAPNSFSLLEIQFTPLAAGVRNAIVSIANNDSDENPYTYAIRGTGRCVSASTSIIPVSGPINTTATITGSHFDTTTTATINGLSMIVTLINSETIEVRIPNGATTGNINVEDRMGCTSITSFTVIDGSIGGCEGSKFLSDLIISEVTDATAGGLSYIEIYNGTGAPVALGNYAIGIYNNGAASPTNTLTLNAVTLNHNAIYIVAIGITNSPTSGNTCPQTGGNGQLANQTSTLVGINKKDQEHDVLRLLKSKNTVVVDEFGIYQDKSWMDTTIITGDRGFNFRRLYSASQLPNPIFNLADWNVIDWAGSGATSCSTNDYSNIGIFDFSGGNPPTITLNPTLPLNSCSLSTTLSVSATEGVNGGFPLAYQWYYNAPNSFNWVAIADTDPMYSGQHTSNLNILNLENFNGFQFYVQVRENGINCYKASIVVPIKIITTTWNGHKWEPLSPSSNTVTILNSDYTTNSKTGSFTTCSLVVKPGYTLNITDDHYVEVLNDVLVSGHSTEQFGEIVVDTKGALVQRGDDLEAGTFILANTGTSRVRKSTPVKQKWYAYTYWSSPVTDASVERALSMAAPSRRFYFEASNYLDTDGNDVDDNGDDWQLATGRMIPGVGYAATSRTTNIPFPRIDQTEFSGPFNTGNITAAIITNSFPTDNDWNLIGNPYPSAIDFKMVHKENANIIDGAAYLWSHFSPPLASNPGNQVLNFNSADYAIITTGSGNIAGASKIIPSDFIPSGQGFFVKGLHGGGTLTFKNSMRMADPTSNSQFFKHEATPVANKLWINLTSDSGVFNQILVAYVEGATDGFDGFAYDAERHLSSGTGASIYTTIPSRHKSYAIQGKAPTSLTLEEEVGLAFQTSITQATVYTISLDQTQGAFLAVNNIYLKDQLLELSHNLNTGDYNFSSATGDFKNRFVIHFKDQTLSVAEAISNADKLSIIELKTGQLQFSVGQQLAIKSVEIIDVLGRTLHHFKGQNSTEIYQLKEVSQAVYIARVVLSNDQIITKRIFKRR
ncbi:putative secreted protein (Por secretion system target) [Gelidibacter sediminis]|uniref:Putative secreted protein (Por secretion system target) n=1 Tax=Gelidibacter sediminis TaxID=1608710 RepID=A0A4R7Q7S9_9FLAO|nr:choice-of-anchor D domain-containing protein [Gelidibacter sediminis]TDU43697.1 putative secreted protein (Por secretion system target) [Gelidibacter sediminis]